MEEELDALVSSRYIVYDSFRFDTLTFVWQRRQCLRREKERWGDFI